MNTEINDTVDRIVRFLEHEDARLPDWITNHMILIALRDERDTRCREINGLGQKVDRLIGLLEGLSGKTEEGLAAKIAQLDRFRKVVVWVLSTSLSRLLAGLAQGCWDYWSTSFRKKAAQSPFPSGKGYRQRGEATIKNICAIIGV